MSAPRVLFVEDEAPFRRFAGGYLEDHGFEVAHAGSAEAALSSFQAAPPDLVLLDLNLPDTHGLELMRRLRALRPGQPVLVLTALGDAATAVTALKAGAADYLTKPVHLDRLAEAARQAIAQGRPEPARPHAVGPTAEASGEPADPPLPTVELVGGHPSWLKLLERLDRVARSGFDCVLLLGESGTGKSALARRLHSAGPRAAGPFVEIDCPSIPEALFESELFGHERGAFTGATGRKRGQIELAAGGTLFLDEVGELPLAVQPKLLRFIEQRRFRRVGGLEDLEADVVVVGATNRDLAADVAAGAFRQDLFHRLDVVSLHVPPLRERGDDVLAIAAHLAAGFAARSGRPAPRLSPSAAHALRAHAFPGNVRELRNLIQRAVAFLDGDAIDARDLELGSGRAGGGGRPGPGEAPEPIEVERLLDAVETCWVELALSTRGSQREAAAALGIDRFALARRVQRAGHGGGRSVAETILEGAPAWAREIVGPAPTALPPDGVDVQGVRRDLEARLVAWALRATGGSRTRCAALLGMSRTSLGRRLDGK